MISEVITPSLKIELERSGPSEGAPIFLIHGWPDSVQTWNGILNQLHDAGFETFAPSLRAYGGTMFQEAATSGRGETPLPRSGETGALARDILDLADALNIPRFGLVGHDWGTRALFDACILAPERIGFAVALSLGWTPPSAGRELSWRQKQCIWYQWYLATPHGAAAFRADPEGFCRHLWETWSPKGWYREEDWQEVLAAFHSPDWCDVVIHFYRARWGLAEPDPYYAADLEVIGRAKEILTPTMVIHGLEDGCCLAELSDGCEDYFPGGYALETLPGIGHFPQREAAEDVGRLILDWASKH